MEQELEPVRSTYTLLSTVGVEFPQPYITTKLDLEEDDPVPAHTAKKTPDEPSGEDEKGEENLTNDNSNNKGTTNNNLINGLGDGSTDSALGLELGERRRAKPKKRVSWIDLERGKPSAVTQVYQVDSPQHYDRSPAPMHREQTLLTAETKTDKLLIVIIIALIIVILIR